MAWRVVAEGTFSELRQLIADREYPKGTKIRVEMRTIVPWAFDVAGAELLFKPFVPAGVDLIDVYGEGEYGYADMVVDPPIALLPLLLAIAKWGTVVVVAGYVLYLLVSFVRVLASPLAAAAMSFVIGAAVGIAGLIFLATRVPERSRAP